MNKYLSISASVAAAGFILAAASHSADAASAKSQLFIDKLNQLSDNSAESLAIDLDSDGNLDVGDTLRGIFEIETVENLTDGGAANILGSGGVNELTGIFETEVISKVAVGGGLFNYTFGPAASFAAEFSLPTGSMVAWFDDATPDFDRNAANLAAAEGTATDGTLVAATGFTGLDGDELWQALAAPEAPSAAQSVPAGTAVGTFNIQMNVLGGSFFNSIAQVPVLFVGDDGLIDINASGNILGTSGINTPFEVFDNVDFVFNPVTGVPEPATLGLLSAGLLGLGATALRRRRNQAKASK